MRVCACNCKIVCDECVFLYIYLYLGVRTYSKCSVEVGIKLLIFLNVLLVSCLLDGLNMYVLCSLVTLFVIACLLLLKSYKFGETKEKSFVLTAIVSLNLGCMSYTEVISFLTIFAI